MKCHDGPCPPCDHEEYYFCQCGKKQELRKCHEVDEQAFSSNNDSQLFPVRQCVERPILADIILAKKYVTLVIVGIVPEKDQDTVFAEKRVGTY